MYPKPTRVKKQAKPLKRAPLVRKAKKKPVKRYINLIVKQEKRSYYIESIDKIVSLRVRERDNWICIYCGKQVLGGQSNSHFWNRDLMSVRWDMDNCDTACWMPCHSIHLEQRKNGWYRDFKIKQLGQERFDQLAIKAQTLWHLSLVDLKLLALSYEKGLL